MREDYRMSRRERTKDNQQGIVSIIVTMIIMIVLTLIVTGFAQLARNEQREALDRQLSTQAFYAAETGVNDARRAIAAGFTGEKSTCGPNSSVSSLKSSDVGSSTGISYSCLLIRQILPDLKLQNVTQTESSVLPLNSVNPDGTSKPLTTLSIEWKSKDSTFTNIPATVGVFNSNSAWNASKNFGVLRIDLIDATPPLSATNLQNSTFTAFLYPDNNSSPSVVYVANPSQQGQIVGANCIPANNTCSVQINGLTQSNYFIRLKSVYVDSEVKLCGVNCSGSTQFKNAQAEIDSTGKANDEFKRIKVRVNDISELSNTKTLPNYVFDSAEDICKKLSVYPGGADLGGCSL